MGDQTKDAEGFNDPMWVTHERAFPVSTIDGFHQYGMTLRDYFAGQALASIVADGGDATSAAQWAYRFADAMLAERERAK